MWLERIVFVMVAPPLIRRALRPSSGGVLPLLLPAEWGQVKVAPVAAQVLNAAPIGEVGLIDAVALAEKDAQVEGLAVIGCNAEVIVKVSTVVF
jgi:hypothetical protein